MTPKSLEKKNYILTCAHRVFVRKGYANVTMKDIIEECAISRGGIYLYFSSVDEIFVQVISRHNQQKLDRERMSIEEGKPFALLLSEYFVAQKKRLLHMEDSLKAAMYEYTLSHKEPEDREFYAMQFDAIQQRILEIMRCGVAQGKLKPPAAEHYTRQIMLMVEGMSSLALSGQMPPHIIDEQFQILMEKICNHNQKEALA